mmetsp:Transcript_47393/g.141450  ORF Transcript_47393/g.141450 Transcript_47393/m.141450 type:complete len:248 (-) Transcript_47393:631-1374(-)
MRQPCDGGGPGPLGWLCAVAHPEREGVAAIGAPVQEAVGVGRARGRPAPLRSESLRRIEGELRPGRVAEARGRSKPRERQRQAAPDAEGHELAVREPEPLTAWNFAVIVHWIGAWRCRCMCSNARPQGRQLVQNRPVGVHVGLQLQACHERPLLPDQACINVPLAQHPEHFMNQERRLEVGDEEPQSVLAAPLLDPGKHAPQRPGAPSQRRADAVHGQQGKGDPDRGEDIARLLREEVEENLNVLSA